MKYFCFWWLLDVVDLHTVVCYSTQWTILSILSCVSVKISYNVHNKVVKKKSSTPEKQTDVQQFNRNISEHLCFM